jgi:hypothetical protein
MGEDLRALLEVSNQARNFTLDDGNVTTAPAFLSNRRGSGEGRLG